MTVVSEGPLCLKIHLSKPELKKYFTSYDKISFEDPVVQKTISFLLGVASSGVVFETSGKRLIEVFPTLSGGCIFKFTTEPLPQAGPAGDGKNIRLKKRTPMEKSYLFSFVDAETLFRVIESLYANETTRVYESAVYLYQQRYWLHIFLPNTDRKTGLFIGEFCSFSARGENAVGIIVEHGTCLAAPNAIETIGRALRNHIRTGLEDRL